MRQPLGPVLAAAGEDACIALREPRQHAIAVVFHFVEPVPGLRRLADERRELGCDERRQLQFPAVLREAAFRLGLALHALGALGGDVVIAPHVLVIALDEKPCRPILVASRTRKDPGAVKLLAVEAKMQPPFAQRRQRIGILRRPHTLVPKEHLACAILLLRDHALELAILERMVFGLHGETLVGRIEARPLRHRPALQHAGELEPEVVMQPRRGVALDVIAQRLCLFRRGAATRRFP